MSEAHLNIPPSPIFPRAHISTVEINETICCFVISKMKSSSRLPAQLC